MLISCSWILPQKLFRYFFFLHLNPANYFHWLNLHIFVYCLVRLDRLGVIISFSFHEFIPLLTHILRRRKKVRNICMCLCVNQKYSYVLLYSPHFHLQLLWKKFLVSVIVDEKKKHCTSLSFSLSSSHFFSLDFSVWSVLTTFCGHCNELATHL